MTVPADPRRAGPFDGDGATTSFPFEFKVFSEEDILVAVRDTISGIETIAVLHTDYSVTVNPDQDSDPGGTIDFNTAPAVGETTTLVGNLEYGQPVALPDGGAYRAQQVELALDRLGVLVQQVKDSVDRALALAITTDANVSTVLPYPAALRLIGWDSSAQALQNFSASDLGITLASSAWRTQRFSGDGSEVNFELDYDAGVASNIDLFVQTGGDRVTQVAGVDFTYNATTQTITFTTPPGVGTNNVVARYGQAVPASTVPDYVLEEADIGVTVQGYDATLLNASAIGVSVQAYDADTAKTDVAQTYTKGQRGSIVALTDGATITPDMADGNFFSVTLGGNRTLQNPTNLTAGQSGSIFITQDGSGSKTLSYGSYWDFAGGSAPTLSTAANAVDRLDYVVRTTTSIHAVLTKAWS